MSDNVGLRRLRYFPTWIENKLWLMCRWSDTRTHTHTIGSFYTRMMYNWIPSVLSVLEEFILCKNKKNSIQRLVCASLQQSLSPVSIVYYASLSRRTSALMSLERIQRYLVWQFAWETKQMHANIKQKKTNKRIPAKKKRLTGLTKIDARIVNQRSWRVTNKAKLRNESNLSAKTNRQQWLHAVESKTRKKQNE